MNTTDEITARLEFAISAARAGGGATLEYFQRRDFGLETKADGSPVTDADRACERVIRDRLMAEYSDDGVLGEEFGDTPGTTGFRWIIDPVDGTFSFVNGVPLYTTLIGLEQLPTSAGEHGTAVAGVVHAPVLDEMVYARLGGGAWHTTGGREPVRARVSSASRLDEATVCTTSLDYWNNGTAGIWGRIAGAARHTRGWPDAYGVLLTATGRCDAVVEPELKSWDAAPFGPILTEAGGRSTDWNGVETPHADCIVTSNGRIHDELLRLIRG